MKGTTWAMAFVNGADIQLNVREDNKRSSHRLMYDPLKKAFFENGNLNRQVNVPMVGYHKHVIDEAKNMAGLRLDWSDTGVSWDFDFTPTQSLITSAVVRIAYSNETSLAFKILPWMHATVKEQDKSIALDATAAEEGVSAARSLRTLDITSHVKGFYGFTLIIKRTHGRYVTDETFLFAHALSEPLASPDQTFPFEVQTTHEFDGDYSGFPVDPPVEIRTLGLILGGPDADFKVVLEMDEVDIDWSHADDPNAAHDKYGLLGGQLPFKLDVAVGPPTITLGYDPVRDVFYQNSEQSPLAEGFLQGARAQGVRRHEEHDWKQAYLCRDEHYFPGFGDTIKLPAIEWAVTFSKSRLRVASAALSLVQTTFSPTAGVRWSVRRVAGGGRVAPVYFMEIASDVLQHCTKRPDERTTIIELKKFDISEHVDGAAGFVVRAEFTGQMREWQQAQLFRSDMTQAPVSASQCPFQLCVVLREETQEEAHGLPVDTEALFIKDFCVHRKVLAGGWSAFLAAAAASGKSGFQESEAGFVRIRASAMLAERPHDGEPYDTDMIAKYSSQSLERALRFLYTSTLHDEQSLWDIHDGIDQIGHLMAACDFMSLPSLLGLAELRLRCRVEPDGTNRDVAIRLSERYGSGHMRSVLDAWVARLPRKLTDPDVLAARKRDMQRRAERLELLDDDERLTSRARKVFKEIFERFDEGKKGYHTPEDHERLGRICNGEQFGMVAIDMFDRFGDGEKIKMKGFLNMYQEQIELEEEDVWNDLLKLGYDEKLRRVF
ncbi:hypothetical protein HDU87_002079 [Geranomyces variabilis]|uniref:PAW domain-containing protein n=1 Tax=Geranomyces variabilis TaxID=109894 RepID=A0AAD5TC16_9FUNG|nr:hypothetical protein HDU87_002079 [Geranomyces variabilis]